MMLLINELSARFKTMTDKTQNGLRNASSWFNVLGGLCGLITCGAVLVSGGRYTRQVDVNTDRINVIERGGSPGLIAHEKKDDERVDEIKRRMNKVEEAITLLTDVRGHLGIIDERLDNFAKKFLIQQEQINNLIFPKSKP